jgi:cyclic-di-AMP phosphodiesterase PgpH
VTLEDPPQPQGLLAWLVERSSTASSAGRLLALALVLAVAGASSWLLTPGAFAQRMPGDDALGTPALGNFKAARDYDILDPEATRESREAAVAAELPVFDWDEGAADEAAGRVRDAFGFMRDVLAALGAPGPREAALDVRKRLAGERGAFEARLGLRISDEDFGALSEARFAEPVEGDLVSLVNRGLSGKVLMDRRRLSTARPRGVLSRTIRSGTPQGEQLLDLGAVRDLDDARADVERAAASLPTAMPSAQRQALGRIALSFVRPTLVFNLAETALRQRDAAERVKPVVVRVKRGEKIIGDGEVIERRHLLIFRGIREQTRGRDVLQVRLGAAALISALLLLVWRHAQRHVPGFRPRIRDGLLLASAALGTVGLAAAGLAVGDALHDRFARLSPEALFYLVPFAAGATVVRSVLSAEMALLFGVASAGLVGLVAGNSLFLALHAMLTSVLAAGLVARTRDRAGLFRVGAAVGALGAFLVVATHLFTGRGFADVLAPALAAALSGAVLLPVLAAGTLPLVEWVFGYATDLKLLELANLNHPALKDLIVQAPGTYHHSVIMGSLVEAAADAIGANPLLARVCAYYHDIGKIRNPLHFSENQRSESLHEQLAPSMSALIVKRHVPDGVELARHWRLPPAVADAIPQHHGTRRVSFFWAKAQQRVREAGEQAIALDEEVFRYAGPKPQSRETALVMIADACEASVRSLPEVSTESLRELVHKRINEIFSEGQLDECELTLKDLNAIASAMVRALEAVYHRRPEYPGRPSGAGNEPAQALPQLQLAAPGAPGREGGSAAAIKLVTGERRRP